MYYGLTGPPPRASTGETPFKLAYGTDVMLPIEVESPSYRAITFEEESNKEEFRTNLELIEKVRDQAVQRMEKYKEKTRAYFAKHTRVKLSTRRPGAQGCFSFGPNKHRKVTT